MWVIFGAERIPYSYASVLPVAPMDVPDCLVLFNTFTSIMGADIPVTQLSMDNDAKSYLPHAWDKNSALALRPELAYLNITKEMHVIIFHILIRNVGEHISVDQGRLLNC